MCVFIHYIHAFPFPPESHVRTRCVTMNFHEKKGGAFSEQNSLEFSLPAVQLTCILKDTWILLESCELLSELKDQMIVLIKVLSAFNINIYYWDFWILYTRNLA